MKTILLTGATDGIGLETAKSLAAKGHQLLVHGRNPEKLANTIELLNTIAKNNSSPKVESYQADLSIFDDVHKLIADIKQKHNTLDVIMNNAGIFKTSQTLASNGMDVRFVVNTLSPYLLTKGLAPILAENGRIVNLSSAAQAPIDLKALAGDVQVNDDFQAYVQSKLAITIWSQELAKELKTNQIIVAVNPGSLLASKMVKEGFGMAGNDITIGSDILVRAALSEEFIGKSGYYFDNDAKQFALPHSDAQNSNVCLRVMSTIEEVVSR